MDTLIIVPPDPRNICDDCKKEVAFIKHWGPFVPKGKIGHFCVECFDKRVAFMQKYNFPKPMKKKKKKKK